MVVKSKNCLYGVIKASYILEMLMFRSFLSSSSSTKNKINKTPILHVVLCGVKLGSEQEGRP